MLLKNRWNIWITRLQHACITIATYTNISIYFCNINVKHFKHTVAHMSFRCNVTWLLGWIETSSLQSSTSARSSAAVHGARRCPSGGTAPPWASTWRGLEHPRQARRLGWAPARGREHPGELGGLLDEHRLLGEHRWARDFFKEARMRASRPRRSEREAASVHPNLLDRALSFAEWSDHLNMF
jgi:hypothetical protein